MDEKLLTPTQVATLLNCSAKTVVRMAHAKMIEAVCITEWSVHRKHYRFKKSDVEKFLENKLSKGGLGEIDTELCGDSYQPL